MNKELENILDKVGELYNKYGVKSVTMDDVARELGISKKTLYVYVENKNDLVEKVLDHIVSQNDCSFQKLADKELNAVEEVLEISIHIIKTIQEYNPSTEYDLKKYYPRLYKKLNEVRQEKMYDSVIKNIGKGKKEGLYRNDLDDEIIAKMQTSRFLNITTDQVINHEEVLNPRFVYEMFIYHIRGMANKKGIEVLEKTLQKIDIKEYLQ
ncbi:MAG: TetR/AcrR family transcriptional regulator [Bacteroidales bacterium]|nr:TetR/AcrR family transcriptional regulator [Bacteroidales bacterium]